MATITRTLQKALVSCRCRYVRKRESVIWRGSHFSLVNLNVDTPEKKSVVLKTDKTELQLVQFGGYNKLIDSAKQRTGIEKQEQFALALNDFIKREKYRKGHVAFIRIAMQRMDEFGLENDLVTYNRIIDIFPRGRFAPRRMLDALWARPTPQLELCLDVLTKMEENGVRPSIDTYDIVKAVFGRSLPLEKCIRIMYLFDKYKDMDPYEVRSELPSNPTDLSRLALFRMTGENAELMELQVPEEGNGDEGFVIGGNSDKQLKLLDCLNVEGLSHDLLLHVEGPHRLWLKKTQQYYFTLRLSEGRGVLPQSGKLHTPANEDVMLGLCMCQPFQQESLQRWITKLQERYPTLSKATIIYDLSELAVEDASQESSAFNSKH